MQIKIGCDLTDIAKFKKSASKGGAAFLARIFSPYEMAHARDTQNLAGLFAAKEAVIKALGLPGGSWKKMEVRHLKNGRPVLKMEGRARFRSFDLTITHERMQAMAVAVFIMK